MLRRTTRYTFSMLRSNKRKLAFSLITSLGLADLIQKLYPVAMEVKFGVGYPTRIREVSKRLSPIGVSGISFIRVGDANDGGYVLVEDFSSKDVCLSLGIGDNDSFDQELAGKIQAIHMYDHTIETTPSSMPNAYFHKVGISAKRQPGFVTLEDCLESIPSSTEVILKIDIEGTEWEVFANVRVETLNRFKQIAVEFHGLHRLNDDKHFNLVTESLDKLNKNHAVVNVHANNWSDFDIIGNFPVPDVIEVTYVRRDRLKISSISPVVDPDPLNAPNNPYNFEIQLGFLR